MHILPLLEHLNQTDFFNSSLKYHEKISSNYKNESRIAP